MMSRPFFQNICTSLCHTILNSGVTQHGYSYYLYTAHEGSMVFETVSAFCLDGIQLLFKLIITYCSVIDNLL